MQTEKVLWALSIFWIYVVIGGFLGLVFPYFSFTSPVEAVLPHAILSNDFVKEMVHPAFAQVQDFLGFPTPRPSAPFVYTNDWGGSFGLLVPFVILAWQTGLRRRFKIILGCAAAASIVPVVFSMNRGLWLSLGLGLVYAALRLSLKGRERALIAFVSVTILVAGALFLTPLGEHALRTVGHTPQQQPPRLAV